MNKNEPEIFYCPVCGAKDITYFGGFDKLHNEKIYFEVTCCICDAETLIYYLGQFDE